MVAAHLRADSSHAVLDDVPGRPARFAAGDLAHEAPQDLAALQTVGHFRMKLQPIQAARLVRHGRQRGVVAGGDGAESRRQRNHAVAMAHPDVEHAPARRVAIVLETVKQPRGAAGPYLGGAEFAVRRGLDLSAELRRHGLHAIADSENRHAEREHLGRRFRTFRRVYRLGAARQDHGFWGEAPEFRRIDVVRVDFRVHAEFAHPPRDQLGVLGAEIEYQDPVRMNVGHQLTR